MDRNEDMVEIEVTVKMHGEKAVLIVNAIGDESWIPYNIIDDTSDIYERTPTGSTGTLVIPGWKAEELGWD